MNIIIFLLGIFTSFLIGAQFHAYIPLPAFWVTWGTIILIGLFSIMIENNAKKEKEKQEPEQEPEEQ